MQKAVFFDRDGVLNQEMGDYVTKIQDFHILPDSIESIKYAKDNGFLVFIITNQGGISKGLYNEMDLNLFHENLKNECKKCGTSIDDIYYCKHHPDFGKCLCRKPESLMLEKAISKYNIDVSKSFLIGDNQRDIDSANLVQMKSILIQPNSPKLHLIIEEINNINKKN